MTMTAEERSRINQANARNSTGPKTDAGKQRSRANALKHGLTAEVLTLPDEDPADVQAEADAWTDAFQPRSVEEDALVEQAALGSLRLRRLARAETEVLAEQVRSARGRWEEEQEFRVLGLSARLHNDPARAVLELENFGAGVDFLIERWEGLKDAFDAFGCWNSLVLVKDAIRLIGCDPDRLSRERLEGYELALLAVVCIPGHQDVPALTQFLKASVSPEWYGRYGDAVPTAEDASALLREKIDEELTALKESREVFQERDEASASGAEGRAMAFEDTPRNRLLVRYLKSTESSFDRALKTLAKLQAARKKAETEAKPAASPVDDPRPAAPRNEPNPPRREPMPAVRFDGFESEARETLPITASEMASLSRV